ncbi:MAG: protoporphyrinogen oxidase [Bacteroidota bacterium]
MSEIKTEFLVLGGGISGLTAAYTLMKAGREVTLLEQNDRVGGAIYSLREDGFTFERGANSLASHQAVTDIIEALGIQDALISASVHAPKRYIARDNQIHEVAPSPKFIFGSKLISTRAKFRLVREPFIKSQSPPGETVAEFFTRRLGRENYEYLLNPVIGGIYAGNPETLEMQSVFPQLIEWESEHGSLFKGIQQQRKSGQSRTIVSFKGGMDFLPRAIAQSLGDRILLEREVLKIEKADQGYVVSCKKEGQIEKYHCSYLVSSLPAYQGELFRNLSPQMAALLLEIPYVPMGVLHLAFDAQQLSSSLPQGFGFLLPERESKDLLGVIWNSSVFPSLFSPELKVFTLFVGGSRTLIQSKAQLEEMAPQVLAKFRAYLGISADYKQISPFYWAKAIPQYTLGHAQKRQQIEASRPQNLILVGNYLDRVSIGDNIANATKAIQAFLAQK